MMYLDLDRSAFPQGELLVAEPSGKLLGHEAAEGALDRDRGLLLMQSMLGTQIVE